MDYEPRHEAFWFIGGVDVPHNVVNWRKKYKWLKDRAHEPLDRPVQYIGMSCTCTIVTKISDQSS